MAFRKRNVAVTSRSLTNPSSPASEPSRPPGLATTQIPGVRPSPLDGQLTTSTGTSSLDGLLAGHGGLALGSSILIEESGTTDYAGTLLRYYAAEGIVQGHKVHVVGAGEQWARELPGLAAPTETRDWGNSTNAKERMKIAWRYERLGEFGSANARAPPLSTPGHGQSEADRDHSPPVFCHSFDLTARLPLPPPALIGFVPPRPVISVTSPFIQVIQTLSNDLRSTDSHLNHRVVIPSLLSPAYYSPAASSPEQVLQFLHALRSLLRQYPTRLTAMVSLPLSLYPRETGLTRWMELLCDGVIELAPFPHTVDAGPSLNTSGAATAEEEKPQGMVKVHRLPVFHERGGGGIGAAGVDDDLAFTVSRRKFVIKPFSLPPVEGDTEAQRGDAEGRSSKVDLDF